MTDDIEKVRQLTREIDSRLSDGECELLYKLAKDVPGRQAIIQIGRWKGKSTVWLAKGTEDGQRNKVYSIGPHAGSNAHVSEDERNPYTAFLNNLNKARVQDTVVPLVTTSEEAAKRWHEKIGLLCFNASNDYEDVKHALLCWQRYLLPGARVTLHGCDQPGPARVLQEALGDCGNFIFIQSIDTTAVVAIDKCIHHWIIDSNEIGICKCCGRKRNFKRIRRESFTLEKSSRTGPAIGGEPNRVKSKKGK